MRNTVSSLKQNYVLASNGCSLSHNNPMQNPIAASHMSKSFKTLFAQKVIFSESQKTPLLSTSLESSCQLAGPKTPAFSEGCSISDTPLSGIDHVGGTPEPAEIVEETKVVENNDCYSEAVLDSNRIPVDTQGLANVTPTACDEIGDIEAESNMGKSCFLKEALCPEGTPAKLISTPARLMTATPALQTPKRCHIAQNEASTPSPNKLVRRPPRRPLFLSPVKNKKADDEINEKEESSGDAYLLKLLPEALRQSVSSFDFVHFVIHLITSHSLVILF